MIDRFVISAACLAAFSFPTVAHSQSLKDNPPAVPGSTTPTSGIARVIDASRYGIFPCRPDAKMQVSARPPRTPEQPELRFPARRVSIPLFAQKTCAEKLAHVFVSTGLTFDGSRSPVAADWLTVPEPPALAMEEDSWSESSRFEAPVLPTRSKENSTQGIQWWPLLQQSFNFLVLEHSFRIATDPFLRYLLWHKPFWHDWAASNQHFNFNQWGDGDDFIVNYIGHPLEGGVTGNIFIVNDPKGRSQTFGRSRSYWMSRLRAMAFAAVYSAQFEAGPILSESAIGNEGGYYYKPGCDPALTCAGGGDKKPITNNTGWVDFVVTPAVGLGWIVLEDAIDIEIIDRLAKGDDRLGWKILRGSLTPSHVMANFVAGKTPWYRYRIDGPDGGSLFDWHKTGPSPKFSFEEVKRWEIGAHYTYLSLPVDTETCLSCRVGNSGFGTNFAYRITNRLWVDSDVNYFPGSGNFGQKGGMVQGMFGPRYGYTGKSWGLYFKLRPGFIYYDKTLTAESAGNFTNATRFAFDVGSIFEWYTSAHSVLRVDAGTTVVRYLTGRDDPRQPPGNILSTDYIVSQSNFQLAAGYTYRF